MGTSLVIKLYNKVTPLNRTAAFGRNWKQGYKSQQLYSNKHSIFSQFPITTLTNFSAKKEEKTHMLLCMEYVRFRRGWDVSNLNSRISQEISYERYLWCITLSFLCYLLRVAFYCLRCKPVFLFTSINQWDLCSFSWNGHRFPLIETIRGQIRSDRDIIQWRPSHFIETRK